MGQGFGEFFWWSAYRPVYLLNLLRPDSGGVHDQVFESTNLIPIMGWGSLVPD